MIFRVSVMACALMLSAMTVSACSSKASTTTTTTTSNGNSGGSGNAGSVGTTTSTVPDANQTIDGTVDDVTFGYPSSGSIGSFCYGGNSSNSPTLGAGNGVFVKGSDGSVLAEVYLSGGKIVDASTSHYVTSGQACEWTWSAKVPTVDEYEVTLDGTNAAPVNYTLAQMQQANWMVGMSFS